MENINWNIVVTAVIAITGLIAPVFTTYLNNRHIQQMKDKEILLDKYKNDTLHKRKLVENFLRSMSSNSALGEIMRNFYLLFPYLSDKDIYLIKNAIEVSRIKYGDSIFEGFLKYEKRDDVLEILKNVINE